jgi:hypothetical protein
MIDTNSCIGTYTCNNKILAVWEIPSTGVGLSNIINLTELVM